MSASAPAFDGPERCGADREAVWCTREPSRPSARPWRLGVVPTCPAKHERACVQDAPVAPNVSVAVLLQPPLSSPAGTSWQCSWRTSSAFLDATLTACTASSTSCSGDTCASKHFTMTLACSPHSQPEPPRAPYGALCPFFLFLFGSALALTDLPGQPPADLSQANFAQEA